MRAKFILPEQLRKGEMKAHHFMGYQKHFDKAEGLEMLERVRKLILEIMSDFYHPPAAILLGPTDYFKLGCVLSELRAQQNPMSETGLIVDGVKIFPKMSEGLDFIPGTDVALLAAVGKKL